MRTHQTTARRTSGRTCRMAATVAVGGALLAGGITTAASASAATGDTGILTRIKACESGGSYSAQNPTSSASGAYQFLTSTWRSLPAAAGYSTAASAPAAVQDQAARQLFAQQGTSPWLASASCWRGGTVPSTATAARSSATRSTETSTSRSYRYQSSVTSSSARGGADHEDRYDTVAPARDSERWTGHTGSAQYGSSVRRDEVNNEHSSNTVHRSYTHRSNTEGSSSEND